jgi:trimeric autotransporter adhesin
VPTIFSMAQNFPNPFNPSTTIRFTVPENANVTIQIYDLTGREVASLLNGVFRNIGVYNVPFNASMYSLSSGVYFYRITANDPASNAVKFTEVKRMILIK